MRIRIRELLEEREWTTYMLAHADPRLSASFCYRLVRRDGEFSCLSGDQAAALCDVLAVDPNELFDRPKKPRKR